jgi:hypothetical protein
MKFKAKDSGSKSVGILGVEYKADAKGLIEIPDSVVVAFNAAGRHEEFASLGVVRLYDGDNMP